jgi:phosphoglycerol transferase MdoB-like AlkP superfamily enzyme
MGDEPRTPRARTFVPALRSQAAVLLSDRFFFLTVGLLLVKSLMAMLLINNPDHSVLDTGYYDDFQISYVIFIAFIVIPLAPGFLLRGRSRLVYYLAVNGALSLLLIADLWYYRAYSTFLSFLLWQQKGNLGGLSDSIRSLSRRVDLLFLADLAVLVPLTLVRRRLGHGARRAVPLAVGLVLAAAGALWLMHLKLDVNGTDSEPRFVYPCWAARQTIAYQSPLGFHVLDFWFVYLRPRSVSLSPAQRNEIGAWYEAKRERLPDNRYRSVLAGRNLIVVQVESLENFVIGQRVAGQEITPVLNRLLPNSLYFCTLYDQANEGMSSDSDLMTNTSVYPVRKGSTFFRFPGNSYLSLPRLLRAAGYRTTVAMHPDPGAYWNWENALTAIGFDTCLDMSAFTNTEILGLGLSDADFLPQAAARISALPEPFYAFAVTLTSHAPFELPEEDCELHLEEPLASSVLGTAFQCFRYADRQLGVFLERLRASGLLDRSVVVFYGDHGSVHRFYNDEVQQIPGTEAWMRDGRCLVPFIVYAPGLAGERIPVTGGHIDIMPTLLYLLGIDEERTAAAAMGRNLLKTTRDVAVLRDGTVVGRDKDTPVAAHAVRGLAIADLMIQGDYFRPVVGAPTR